MEYVVTLPNRDNNGNGNSNANRCNNGNGTSNANCDNNGNCNSNANRDNDSEKSLITEDESMMSAIVIQQIGRI